MTDNHRNAAFAFAQGTLADYAVEVQFFDQTDQPEQRVTLPLGLFADQTSALGDRMPFVRWVK
ncbi:MAG: hypothetical protein RIR14_1303 [Pseudomonadota bacterium]|jgi:hypothetical protein